MRASGVYIPATGRTALLDAAGGLLVELDHDDLAALMRDLGPALHRSAQHRQRENQLIAMQAASRAARAAEQQPTRRATDFGALQEIES